MDESKKKQIFTIYSCSAEQCEELYKKLVKLVGKENVEKFNEPYYFYPNCDVLCTEEEMVSVSFHLGLGLPERAWFY